MIFYFSGTGNSKWVASEIANRINDEAYDISKLTDIPKVDNEKQIGFVFPVYAWGIPEPMAIFAKKLKITESFTFGICTCGSEAGLTLKNFSKLYHLDSSYSITMPSNYILGEDIEDKSIILEKINKAKKKIEIISDEISKRVKVYSVNEGSFANLKSNVINSGFNKFARSTKPFIVDKDKCNGCGLCAKICPAKTITIVNGSPVWNKNCYQCLRMHQLLSEDCNSIWKKY